MISLSESTFPPSLVVLSSMQHKLRDVFPFSFRFRFAGFVFLGFLLLLALVGKCYIILAGSKKSAKKRGGPKKRAGPMWQPITPGIILLSLRVNELCWRWNDFLSEIAVIFNSIFGFVFLFLRGSFRECCYFFFDFFFLAGGWAGAFVFGGSLWILLYQNPLLPFSG